MPTTTNNQQAGPSEEPPTEDWLAIVRERASRLRFGTIQVTVHDGRVTQIESIERTRLSPSAPR